MTAGDDGGSAFDRATAVSRDGTTGTGLARYRAVVDGTWSVGGAANGGYLMALAARAALDAAGEGHEHPLACTAAFADRTPFGDVAVEVEVLRTGRSTSVLRARITDPATGRPCVDVSVTAGRLGHGDPLVPGPPPPAMPALQECVRLSGGLSGTPTPIFDVVTEHFDPATVRWGAGEPSGAGELRTWLSFADGREPDPLALVCLGDALPPPSFDVPGLVLGWVPTLQLSTFVRAVPAPGPLRARTVARSVGAGMVDETCDLWDATGRLVAVTHQLAVVRSS